MICISQAGAWVPMTGTGVSTFVNWASPGAVGSTTPNSGAFTDVTLNKLYVTGTGAPLVGSALVFKTDSTFNGGTAQINALNATLTAAPSGSTQNWAKNAIYGYCKNTDNTSSGAYQDCIGVLGAAEVVAPLSVGRAFGFNAAVYVDAGADGTAVGSEVDVINYGSSPSGFSPTKPKDGYIAVCAGPNTCTDGIFVLGNTAGGGYWNNGLVIRDINTGGKFIDLRNATQSLASIDGSGNLSANSGTFTSVNVAGTQVIDNAAHVDAARLANLTGIVPQTALGTGGTGGGTKALLDNGTWGTLGTAGFSGTKVAGACTFTIVNGLITNVTGC
jgi:hypothetical protein